MTSNWVSIRASGRRRTSESSMPRKMPFQSRRHQTIFQWFPRTSFLAFLRFALSWKGQFSRATLHKGTNDLDSMIAIDLFTERKACWENGGDFEGETPQSQSLVKRYLANLRAWFRYVDIFGSWISDRGLRRAMWFAKKLVVISWNRLLKRVIRVTAA